MTGRKYSLLFLLLSSFLPLFDGILVALGLTCRDAALAARDFAIGDSGTNPIPMPISLPFPIQCSFSIFYVKTIY